MIVGIEGVDAKVTMEAQLLIAEGGSVIVGVERVSVTNRYPACKA